MTYFIACLFTMFTQSVYGANQPSKSGNSRPKQPAEDDRIAFRTGFSLDTFNYKETNVPDFQQISLKISGALSYILQDMPISFELSGYSALASLSNSGSKSAKLFGIGGAAYYYFQSKSVERWKPLIGLGYAYDRMIISGNSFGVNHVAGPKLILGVEKPVRQRDSLNLSIQYGKVFGNEKTTLAGWTGGIGLIYEVYINDQIPTVLLFSSYSMASLKVSSVEVTNNDFVVGGGIEFH